MARKLKQLKLNLFTTIKNVDSVNNRLHIDTKDHVLSEEHYGFYLIGTLTNGRSHLNPRIYLSNQHKVEYYKEKAKTNSSYKKNVKKNDVEVFDMDKNYLKFIQNFIQMKFSNEIFTEIKTRHILLGLSLYIKYLIKINKIYLSIDEVKTSELSQVYSNYNNLNQSNIKYLDLFFDQVGMPLKQIRFAKMNKKIVTRKLKKEKNNISSSLIYQIETYIKDYFVNTKKAVEEYWNWSDEFKSKFFMTQNDLLRTFFDLINMYPNRKNNIFVQLLRSKLKYDFGINVDFLICSNLEQKQELELKKNQLEKLSLNGKNINIKNKKYAFFWLMEMFPKYPFDNTISIKYKNISQIKIKYIRDWLSNHFNMDFKTIVSQLYPQNNDIYPLYLLLLIKTGVNQEVLKDWKIRKNENEIYSIVADQLDMFTIIDGTKERSNSNISVVLQNNSLEKRYLDFYIKWATPIYNYSQNKKVFQYLNNSGGLSKKFQEIGNSFLENVKNSPTSFFKRYEVIDYKGQRVQEIDHTQVRKSHNYQDFLRGKAEFERQLRKNHKSIDTTKIYYENQNFEWEDSKKHKIALAQNLLVGIFKGKITREDHKTASLFIPGPMSDCKNNKHPTFDKALVLKDNEFCCDWTKCLTGCDKSCVIPKIHGPVILSWINYMDNQRKEFLRNEDWEKEYFIDYKAAEDTISHFKEAEIDFSKKEAYKHDNFVRMKFSRTVKIKGYSNG